MEYRWDDFISDSEETVEDGGILEKKLVEANEPKNTEVELVESPKQPARRIQRSLFPWVRQKKVLSGSTEQSMRQNEKRDNQPLFLWTGRKNKSAESEDRSARNKTARPKEIPVIVIDDKSVEEEIEEPTVRLHHKLVIDGIKVEMPVKPYPCQQDVIKSIISGCKTQQNCLLESPTGSGKTLALLCGSLAWQSDYQKKLDEAKKLETGIHEAGTSESTDPDTLGCGKQPGCKQSVGGCDGVDELDLSMFDWADDDLSDYISRPCSKKVPTIYYGSRTHRQIGQVIQELRKTVYSNKRMTVLSSREFSCIQDTNRNKTELCAELLDPTKRGGCPYYNEHNKFALGSYTKLARHGVQSPWEIEDLVSVGRDLGLCPFFGARALMQEAEIIFCPYNYLIDPAIRETMQLDVRGSIIIFDEAHNIEDSCRNAGSVSLTVSTLDTIITDCTNIIEIATGKKRVQEAAYAAMVQSYCQKLREFINVTALKQQGGVYDAQSSDQWTGIQLLTNFEIHGINGKATNNFIRSAKEGICVFNIAKESSRQGKITSLPTFSAETVRKLEMILMALNMVMSPQHAIDYRTVVKQVALGFKKQKSLEFICMNPGVIFGPLCAMARSIILASGTLAPTKSFAGELGVKFPFTIQANHVTPQEHIFIKCVTKGPRGKSLMANYQTVNTWDFQDEVGSILLNVCEETPHGILMFFSSYTVMNTLIKRWESNDTLNKLSEKKEIFQETRGSGELTSMMANYRKVIKNTSNGPVDNINGAVLFAVFRGKVAEGIDFSDNEARAVITIGIPFPVKSEPSVDMKFRYNNDNRNKGLLSGNDWYACQAFRALNQALGRAIRHQNDWGAIILIDERFDNVYYVNLLPTWVQSMWIRQRESQSELSIALRTFVAKQKQREREGNVKST